MRKKINKLLTVVFVLFVISQGKTEIFSQNISSTETQDINIGRKLKVFSQILGEEREIYVYQPEKVKRKIPLLIVFDAESLLILTR